MVISGKVKFPSDRLYKHGTRRKVVFETPQGDVIVWGEANELDPGLIRKGMPAQVEVTGTDNRGNQVGKIVAIAGNGIHAATPVNGNHAAPHAPYPPQTPPATGYPQQGPPITSPVTGQQDPGANYNMPDPFELDERASLYRRMYVHIWNELVNDEKMPQVSDEVRQKCVATIFIQACRG